MNFTDKISLKCHWNHCLLIGLWHFVHSLCVSLRHCCISWPTLRHTGL